MAAKTSPAQTKKAASKTTKKKKVPTKTTKTTTKKKAASTSQQAPTKAGPIPFVRPADGAFWLMKSEPDVYGIETLERDGVTGWEGVRNYMARNFMRDHMRIGDLVLFYHSNADPSGIAGLARVHSAPLPDPSQFDVDGHYYDADSAPDAPRWMMVQVAFVERFSSLLSLDQLRADPALTGMPLLQRGQRLSVQPVSRAHMGHVLRTAKARTPLPR